MGRIEALLGVLVAAVSSGDDEQVRENAEAIYEETVGKYKPIIDLAPWLLPKLTRDLKPLSVAFYKLGIEYNSDPEVQNLVKELSVQVAINRMERLNEMMEIGFTREEAMALLLQDAANWNAAVQAVRQSSSVTKKDSGS